jgi:protein-tyrosine phosphatase
MSDEPETPLSDDDRRWLPFEGANNFRDLGGYQAADARTVRWGVIFRSGMLATLTDRDLEHLADLNLRLLCDLRTSDERRKHPNRMPAEEPPEVMSLTVWPRAVTELEVLIRGGRIWERLGATDLSADDTRGVMCGFYRSYVMDHTTEYATLLKRLCKTGSRPAVIHCAGGKDRTGVAAALVLRVLGVPIEQIVHDYQLTDRLIPEWAKQARDGVVPAHIHAVLRSDPDFLLAAFEAIQRRHGSFEGYLRDALGLTDRERDALCTALLE